MLNSLHNLIGYYHQCPERVAWPEQELGPPRRLYFNAGRMFVQIYVAPNVISKYDSCTKSGLMDRATSPANPTPVGSSGQAIWSVRYGSVRVSTDPSSRTFADHSSLPVPSPLPAHRKRQAPLAASHTGELATPAPGRSSAGARAISPPRQGAAPTRHGRGPGPRGREREREIKTGAARQGPRRSVVDRRRSSRGSLSSPLPMLKSYLTKCRSRNGN